MLVFVKKNMEDHVIQLNSTNEELFFVTIKMFPQLIPCPLAIYNIKFSKNSFKKKHMGGLMPRMQSFCLSLIEWIFMKVLLRLECNSVHTVECCNLKYNCGVSL